MKLDKKGFTLIELIVSIALLSIIMVFMVNLFMEARVMFNDSRSISVFESDKRYIVRTLSNDLTDYTASVTKTGNKIEFEFKELGETKALEIINENGKTYVFYGCETYCNNEAKSISSYKKLIPDGSIVGNIEFEEATESSKLGSVIIPIEIAGKDESIKVFYSYKEIDNFESYFLADKILNFAKDSNEDLIDTIDLGPNSDNTCTNTLAYDGTDDNNLRFVGKNPCNYVEFNNELWRIIGVMRNVEDENANKDTSIKLIRAETLGDYSWDTSKSGEEGATSNYGINEWTQADLMKELNTDYLNPNLEDNPLWYNGSKNYKSKAFDRTKALNENAQSLIKKVKWYLGGTLYQSDLIPENSYKSERSDIVFPQSEGYPCDDPFCPRQTTWMGKVALPYPSDVGFATSGGETTSREKCTQELSTYYDDGQTWMNSSYRDCVNNDWLNLDYIWFITPNTYLENCVEMSVYPAYTFYADAYNNLAVYPTVYLKKDIIVTSGDGSEDLPYKIQLDN